MQIKQKQNKTKLKNKKSLKNHKNQCKIQNRQSCRGGVRVSGGHLCEAEAPTEATAETSAPPV